IIVARPIGQDQHIGFILNRPTQMTLGQLFTQHAPSRKVPDPVFLGGPISSESIFALVQTSKNPGGRSVKLSDNLFAVIDGKLVDDVIEKDPQHARFVAGLVAWRSGELSEEVKRGAWYVLDADSAVVLRKPDGLWEELVRSAEQHDNGIEREIRVRALTPNSPYRWSCRLECWLENQAARSSMSCFESAPAMPFMLGLGG